MADNHYPTVDVDFVIKHLKICPKFIKDSYFSIGTSHNFIKIGNQPMYKRLVSVKEVGNKQVNYLQAVGVAANYGFLTELGEWLEMNRSWKDGAYFAH